MQSCGMPLVLYVAAGSALGGAARYLLGTWIDARLLERAGGLSLGTLAVNLLGSFLIALLVPFAQDERGKALLLFGLMGGFTTYSSFALHSVLFFEKAMWLQLGLLVLATLLGCMLAAAAGLACGAWLKGSC